MLRVVRGKENAKGSSINDISREAGKRLPKFMPKEGRLREGGGVPKSRRHLWGARPLMLRMRMGSVGVT